MLLHLQKSTGYGVRWSYLQRKMSGTDLLVFDDFRESGFRESVCGGTMVVWRTRYLRLGQGSTLLIYFTTWGVFTGPKGHNLLISSGDPNSLELSSSESVRQACRLTRVTFSLTPHRPYCCCPFFSSSFTQVVFHVEDVVPLLVLWVLSRDNFFLGRYCLSGTVGSFEMFVMVDSCTLRKTEDPELSRIRRQGRSGPSRSPCSGGTVESTVFLYLVLSLLSEWCGERVGRSSPGFLSLFEIWTIVFKSNLVWRENYGLFLLWLSLVFYSTPFSFLIDCLSKRFHHPLFTSIKD